MPYSLLQLAEAFISAGELADALDALGVHLAAQPDDASALRLRAAVLLRQGDPASLQAALADLAALPVPTAADLAQQSIVYERMGMAGAALDAARQALALRPDDERLAERLVWLLAAYDDLLGALEVARAQPRTWRWLEREGDLLGQIGDYVTAGARYGLALAQIEGAFPAGGAFADSLRAAVLLKRAEAFRQTDDPVSAAGCLDAAEALSPAEPLIPFLRGLLLAQAGDPDGAAALCAPAYAAASAALRAEMCRALADDQRLAALADRLSLRPAAGGQRAAPSRPDP